MSSTTDRLSEEKKEKKQEAICMLCWCVWESFLSSFSSLFFFLTLYAVDAVATDVFFFFILFSGLIFIPHTSYISIYIYIQLKHVMHVVHAQNLTNVCCFVGLCYGFLLSTYISCSSHSTYWECRERSSLHLFFLLFYSNKQTNT